MRLKLTILFLGFSLLAACGTGPSNPPTARASTLQPIAVAVQRPTLPALPTELPVVFSHLPPGTYQVHLHAICSGIQGYHLAYLPDLAVGPAHTGQVLVPTADFGRGWCVIVYADALRNIVLVTQPV